MNENEVPNGQWHNLLNTWLLADWCFVVLRYQDCVSEDGAVNRSVRRRVEEHAGRNLIRQVSPRRKSGRRRSISQIPTFLSRRKRVRDSSYL